MNIQNQCDHPNCSNDAIKTYSDGNGNSLDLCNRHYYELVSGQKTLGVSTPSDPLTNTSSNTWDINWEV